MELADRVFEGREYDKQLLHDYGFKPFGGAFRYETLIMDGQFIFQVTILDDRFYSDVTEVETGDIFSLYHVDDATGSFIGQLNTKQKKYLTIFVKNVLTMEFSNVVRRNSFWNTFLKNIRPRLSICGINIRIMPFCAVKIIKSGMPFCLLLNALNWDLTGTGLPRS